MQPERLAIVLRPRTGWEALDLGFQMAREWWRPIWAVWFSIYLPVAALCMLSFSNRFHALLLLWWLKPVFDRAVLHTVSRAVFGEPQGAWATMRAARQWLPPGLLMSLTLSRLNFARSFALPVAQLEGQRGGASRRRQAALGSRMRNVGVWLTVVCVHPEWVAMFGLAGLAAMLEPSATQPGPEDEAGSSIWAQMSRWGLREIIFYVGAVSLVEPFYVTAGFALYLNRRAILEGWDIELALRRLDERLRTALPGAALATFFLVALIALPASPSAVAAEVARKSPRAEIRAVLDGPDFSGRKEVTRWHYIGDIKPDKGADRELAALWARLSELLGQAAEFVLWIAAAMLVVTAWYYLRRFIPEPRLRQRPGYHPPAALFGLDLAPGSLPDDIAATAADMARQGRAREALSLLYRGALSTLVHRYRLQLGPADTEAQCVLVVSRVLPASADYFVGLVRAWQATAYAAREPDAASIERLCNQWRPHFAPEAGA